MLSVLAVGATVSNACELQEFEGVRIQDVRGQGSKLEWVEESQKSWGCGPSGG